MITLHCDSNTMITLHCDTVTMILLYCDTVVCPVCPVGAPCDACRWNVFEGQGCGNAVMLRTATPFIAHTKKVEKSHQKFTFFTFFAYLCLMKTKQLSLLVAGPYEDSWLHCQIVCQIVGSNAR